jgi:hypothetical protein
VPGNKRIWLAGWLARARTHTHGPRKPFQGDDPYNITNGFVGDWKRRDTSRFPRGDQANYGRKPPALPSLCTKTDRWPCLRNAGTSGCNHPTAKTVLANCGSSPARHLRIQRPEHVGALNAAAPIFDGTGWFFTEGAVARFTDRRSEPSIYERGRWERPRLTA